VKSEKKKNSSIRAGGYLSARLGVKPEKLEEYKETYENGVVSSAGAANFRPRNNGLTSEPMTPDVVAGCAAKRTNDHVDDVAKDVEFIMKRMTDEKVQGGLTNPSNLAVWLALADEKDTTARLMIRTSQDIETAEKNLRILCKAKK